jgi:hypothetical protein
MRDWQRALDEIADVEHRMLGVLDALELSELVTTITGLSAVGAAAILAEAGDPARFDRPRTWVKTRRAWPDARTSPGPSPAPPRSPGAAAQRCAPRPGGQSGAHCATTRSTPPASGI